MRELAIFEYAKTHVKGADGRREQQKRKRAPNLMGYQYIKDEAEMLGHEVREVWRGHPSGAPPDAPLGCSFRA